MNREKTTLEYLEKQKDMACHNLLCYSKTYAMDTPKEGMEQAFAEALREVEIVEELIDLVGKPIVPKINCSDKGFNWQAVQIKSGRDSRPVDYSGVCGIKMRTAVKEEVDSCFLSMRTELEQEIDRAIISEINAFNFVKYGATKEELKKAHNSMKNSENL